MHHAVRVPTFSPSPFSLSLSLSLSFFLFRTYTGNNLELLHSPLRSWPLPNQPSLHSASTLPNPIGFWQHDQPRSCKNPNLSLSLSLSLSLCFSRSSSFSFTFVPAAALFLFPELIVALSPSGGYRHPFRAPFALLHRSRATPNYPDVTGAGRRLLRANSRDFGKFIGPRSGKLAAERPQGRTRISAYELPIPPVRGGTPSFNFSRRYYDIHFSVYPR
jgi:hypothetical protein